MQISPRHDFVVIKRIEEVRKSAIVLTDQEKPYTGEVLAVGEGKTLKNGKVRPLDVKKGDKVLFGKFSGTEVKVNGEDVLLMREDDVMVVLER